MLLDLKLPDVDGYQLLEELQQQPHLPQLPIIVIFGFSFPEERWRALKLGARRYLVKPIQLPQLSEVIEAEAHSSSP